MVIRTDRYHFTHPIKFNYNYIPQIFLIEIVIY